MKTISVNELRSVEGGASKYVTCPVCGYNSKSSLSERLFWSNSRKQMYLEARHIKGFRYIAGKSVHY